MINVISLGAGKQSSYMLIRALNGDFEYKPDYAIFSDTGCEPKYVYEYLDWLKFYLKERFNFNITVVSAGNLQKDIEDYIDGKRDRVASIPLRLEDNGLVMRQCTNDYKIAPLRRKLQEIRGKERIRLWIGISVDEIERMKVSNVKYIDNYFPLIENRISIDGIKEYFRFNNLREPGKSACKICPFHSDMYWTLFKKQFPEEFANDCCSFDDKIRNYPKIKKKAYLSKHLEPLRKIDFTLKPSLFPELIEECEGLCGL
jgi:hypothetical protein